MTLKQRTPEWREARRKLVTSTDIPIILGLSPYKSEATLARQKLGEIAEDEASFVMRLGSAMEPFIQSEYELKTGVKLMRYSGIVVSKELPWAAASPDFRTLRKPVRLVEGKDSRSRRWDSGELPQDVEAQVRWTMGVTGIHLAEVAAVTRGDLNIYEVEWDNLTWSYLVDIAEDFRKRLAAGGPFSEDSASIKQRYPQDDGTELVADAEIEEAVTELLKLRAAKKDVEDAVDRIETAVKMRMAEATRLTGKGWSVTWKRTKDTTTTDWKSLADGLLRQLPSEQRDALVGIHTNVKEGGRRFLITTPKGEE